MGWLQELKKAVKELMVLFFKRNNGRKPKRVIMYRWAVFRLCYLDTS